MREDPNWREEARKVISKVCCDGEYVDEAIQFIQNLLSQQKEALLTKLEGEVEGVMKDAVFAPNKNGEKMTNLKEKLILKFRNINSDCFYGYKNYSLDIPKDYVINPEEIISFLVSVINQVEEAVKEDLRGKIWYNIKK